MEKWKTKKVRDLVQEGIIHKPLDGNHGGIHPKGDDFVQEGIPFITASDIIGGRVDIKGCKFIALAQANSLRKGFAEKDDVLLTHKASLGRTAIVPELNTDFIVLTPQVTYYRVKDKTRLNNKFLKYYFDSSDFQERLKSFGDAGSTRAYVGISEQLNLPIVLPPIKEQTSIAKILSSLDDKIELNRRMNATLEAMARALFKAWFVDFEPVHANLENRPSTSASPEIAKLFPSDFENGIPKGWQYIKLEELVDTISVTHKFPNDKIVFLNTSDISNGYVLTHKQSDVEGLPGQAKKSIKKHDILYSEIRPANKRFAYIDFDADEYVVSTKLMVLRARSFVDPVFIYYFLKSDETVAHLQMLAESRSGTFPQITFNQLKRLEVLVPNREILEVYTGYLKSIFERANLNVNQNNQLAEIRDTLLPRLISGRIRINGIEEKSKLSSARL